MQFNRWRRKQKSILNARLDKIGITECDLSTRVPPTATSTGLVLSSARGPQQIRVIRTRLDRIGIRWLWRDGHFQNPFYRYPSVRSQQRAADEFQTLFGTPSNHSAK